MPRLKLKSLRTFLAIKRCQGTKSKLVIKQSRSSIYKLVHICATSGKAVNRNTAMGAYKTDEIETYISRFGGKVLTDGKSHDFLMCQNCIQLIVGNVLSPSLYLFHRSIRNRLLVRLNYSWSVSKNNFTEGSPSQLISVPSRLVFVRHCQGISSPIAPPPLTSLSSSYPVASRAVAIIVVVVVVVVAPSSSSNADPNNG